MKKIEGLIIPLIAVLLAFLVGGIIMAALGTNPFTAYVALFMGAFGSSSMLAQTLALTCPLMFTSLAAAFAYKCGVFNLGGEGQFIMGAVAAVTLLELTGIKGTAGIVCALLVSVIAGGIWALIPGILKIRRGLNEMIVSIMLNYIATLIMSLVYTNIFRDGSIPQTAEIDDSLKLPFLSTGFRVHYGIIIALIVGLLLYYIMFHTSYGFKVRAVGNNLTATKINGFRVNFIMLSAFVLSGAIAGLGGSTELLGKQFRLQSGFGSGFGFDGVAIALIAELNPIGALVISFLFAVLRKGSIALQVSMGVPTAIAEMIQALIIIFAVGGTAIVKRKALSGRREKRISKKEKEAAA